VAVRRLWLWFSLGLAVIGLTWFLSGRLVGDEAVPKTPAPQVEVTSSPAGNDGPDTSLRPADRAPDVEMSPTCVTPTGPGIKHFVCSGPLVVSDR
jgi:hypothetical protein